MPFSADSKTVAYNTDAGVAATQWYVDLFAKQKVGQIGFLTDGVTAFRSGKAGMTIDGSFRLGALDGQKGLEYGVAELPARNNIKANFASYWVNRNHVKYGPFVRGLAYSYATDFVNESAQRKVFMDMIDKVALKNVATKDAVAQAAAEEQKLLDAFYKK
jgi:multiple sugar transport system substrate-binding protein